MTAPKTYEVTDQKFETVTLYRATGGNGFDGPRREQRTTLKSKRGKHKPRDRFRGWWVESVAPIVTVHSYGETISDE